MGFKVGNDGYRETKRVNRIRSAKYLKYIRTKPCLICGGPAEAHHLTHAQARAMASKNGDQWVVPLCHVHHMQLHEFAGGERTFWSVNGINPLIWAEEQYAKWKDEQDGDEHDEYG